MANTTTANGLGNKFDDWRSIGVAIFIALVGYTVMVSVPVLSTALVQKVGFTEEQVGRIWGADLGGLSLGAIISAMLVARMNRRHLVFIGVGLSIAANALCNLHVVLHHGRNSHHISEAVFKGTARALRMAVESDPRVSGVPSTKGALAD